MSRNFPRASHAVMRPAQSDCAEDPIGALLVKQKPEVVLAGPSPLSVYKHAERIADPAAIAMLLTSCSSMVDDHEDDLVFELLYLETLLAMQPVKVQALLDQLGEVGDDVRDDVLPAGMLDLVAVRRRTRKLRARLGAAASRVSAAMLMLLGGLPMFGTPDATAAPGSATFQIAAAPVVRVVDANSGNGVAGVQIKSMDEQLLGVTDATGQATLSEEYTETDLLSLEKDGYQMYLLDRAQLSSRNIVSMKPINDVKTAGNKPAVAGKPPTPPKVVQGNGQQAPKLAPPKPPTMPKSPQIRLPMAPKATAAPKVATAPVAAKPAVAPKPAAVAPKLDAPKIAAAPHAVAHTDAGKSAPKAAALPAVPHQPAYKPQPATPTAQAPAARDSQSGEHSVMVPKRVPAPQSDVAGAAGGYYHVKAGDSLSKIAKRHLGNAALWPELAAANRGTIKNPHFIRVGQRITLPKGASHLAKAHATSTVRHYVVKQGDSLFRIAGEQLGDATQWNRIFQLNRTAIANPRFIYPGQRLTLPG